MPLPSEEKPSSSTTSWRFLFNAAQAVNAAALFNFRENVPSKVANLIQDKTNRRPPMHALYIPLLVMPQDDFLFVSLLDSLAKGKVAAPTCFDPSDVKRVLIARANDYLPIAVSAVNSYFVATGYADEDTLDSLDFADAESKAIAEGWNEIFSKMLEERCPAAYMRDLYEYVGLDSTLGVLLAGVPTEDLFA